MNDRLREYINSIFQEAPQTKKVIEVKEEILQNLQDKYEDLLAEGKSEDAAYNIAVASIGDISELIDDMGENANNRDYGQFDTEQRKERRKSALITSVAVALYILCIVPVIIAEDAIEALVFMFIMVAVATALLIYNHMTKSTYRKTDDTLAEEFKEWRESTSQKTQIYKAMGSALWAITVVIYILISFWTHAWHITWVIFLIAVAIQNIIKAGLDLRR